MGGFDALMPYPTYLIVWTDQIMGMLTRHDQEIPKPDEQAAWQL